MHQLTPKALFALLVSTCLSSAPSFAAHVDNLITKTIDLKAEVQQGPLVCQNKAYLVVSADQNNSPKLLKINLSRFEKDNLSKINPIVLQSFSNLKKGYGNDIIDCDPDTGNYFFVKNEQSNNVATLASHDATNDKKLWQFTLDAAYIYPQIEDIVVAENTDTMLVRVFHLRIGKTPSDMPDTLLAINKKTGKLLWKMDLPTLRPMIYIFGDTFYLADNSISAYKLANAEFKWKYTGSKYDKYDFPLQLDKKMNTIITGYGSSGASYEPAEIIAIHADNGTLSWKLPEHKFINLAYMRHVYNGLTYSSENTIKWMSLSQNANEAPVLQNQWELGPLPSGRGYIAHLLRTNALTIAQVEDNYSSHDSQLAVFNNHGDKLGMLSFKSNVSVATKSWEDWIVYTSDDGMFGLLRAKSDPSLPHKPAVCPSVMAIQSIGFNQAFADQTGWWAMNTKNNYGLQEDWSFGLWVGEASNANDALTKANRIVTSLKLANGPYQMDEVWGCEYSGGESFGIALTPPQS